MSPSIVKSPERVRPPGVKIIQRLDTPEATSRAFAISHRENLIFHNCDTIKFAKKGHFLELCLHVPVRLLRMLNANLLECEKSMVKIPSFHRSPLLW